MNQLKVLAINGSYRDDGLTDQVVEVALEALTAAGAAVENVKLREYPIEFCLNCRECTLQPGPGPGSCVLDDGMAALIEKIEAADAYILAAPTNFSSVTAIFKRFMERLIAYVYWPWNRPWPEYRKRRAARKKALLVTSSAAPAMLGRLGFGSGRQLKMTAKIIGAQSIGLIYTGRANREKHQRLKPATLARTRELAQRLAARTSG